MRRWRNVLAFIALGCARTPSSGIQGTGTIELTDVDVAPMVPARVVRVWVDDGARVRQGDTLVSLTQSTLAPDIAQRRARVAAAEAELRDLAAGSRPAEIARSEAELRSAEAEAARTATEKTRYDSLAARGDVSASQRDAIATAARTAASRAEAAREALRLVREGARPERITAARANVATARASLAAAEATASDLVLIAPMDGVVLGHYVEPGAVVSPGEAALTVGDASRPWARIYVASTMLPRVRVGQPAVAVLDGLPGRRFAGRVTTIATKAEFTPRIALTKDERADLMFAVKVEFRDSTGTLKPGLPATVTIDTARGSAER